MKHFHALRIDEVRPETDDAIIVTLAAVPEALQQRYDYLPGQYLTLRAFIDGRDVRRAYSICSAVQDRRLRIAIKRVPNGVFSTWAHAHLRAGDSIDVLPPDGGFHVQLDSEAKRHYAGFAAGSGIAPLLSIIATTLATEPYSCFTLVYVSRSQDTMMFREALVGLKNRYLSRFSLIALFSREHQDCALLSGRLDAARCRALFQRWLPVTSIDYAFLCGPPAMMDTVAGELRAHDFAENRILREYFAPATDQPALLPPMDDPAAGGVHITVTLDGVTRTIALQQSGQTILEAALSADIDLSYACKGGVCGACRCRVVDGDVTMSGNYVLSDSEIARGIVLSCRSIPVSPHVVLDFDSDALAPALATARPQPAATVTEDL